MDSSSNAAARALATGNPLGALDRVALREDPTGLALRGIAMAQLGELAAARELLRRAGRGFGSRHPLARARCVVAEAEVALAMREFGTSRRVEDAIEVLDGAGDWRNAQHARLLRLRECLLLGRVDEALRRRAELERTEMTPTLRAMAELVGAELEIRRVRTGAATAALQRGMEAAAEAGIPALERELLACKQLLTRPAARLRRSGEERSVTLAEVEALRSGGALLIDACRRSVGETSLARRPALFVLARLLAEAWPDEVSRERLQTAGLGQAKPNDSSRARLRVEIGRLRKALGEQATVEPHAGGYRLKSANDGVCVLLPPREGDAAAVLGLLEDGAPWSTSSLALALGLSQRTVQRTLRGLEAEDRVRSIGRARAKRWLAPSLGGFTTTLLLPTADPAG